LLKIANNLFGLVRLNLIKPEETDLFDKLIEHHCIEEDFDMFYERKFKKPISAHMTFYEFKKRLFEYLPFLFSKGASEATNVIDYNDMVWLPNYLNMQLRQYQWILVDEAQDLNVAQLNIVLRSISNDGRIIFVGDRAQAIYGFAGADSNSIENIIKVTGACRLPLSICYRCPKSHIEMAAKIVPQIQAYENNIDGKITRISSTQLNKYIQPGDPGATHLICKRQTRQGFQRLSRFHTKSQNPRQIKV
jgi:superfamily I DNA/RNA helicase